MNALRVLQIRGIRWTLKLHVCMWRARMIGVETALMSIRNVSCNLRWRRGGDGNTSGWKPAVDGRKILISFCDGVINLYLLIKTITSILSSANIRRVIDRFLPAVQCMEISQRCRHRSWTHVGLFRRCRRSSGFERE